ncbi:hypothetical protein [Xylella fastidiosa]|uniref:hypothetical protein n=1 Tax=Xylella fastidiosa TaxID=2371 RepID=UPI0007333D6C|nr:hypothetical protein [Xylella fastidiosa]
MASAILIAAGTAVWNVIRAVNSAVNQTIGWKAALLAVGAVLARAFALNPVTWLIAGIVALVALVDDFMTYLDGGESLLGAFWGPLIAYAKRAKAVIEHLTPTLKAVGVLLAGLAIGQVVSNIGRLVGAGRTLALWLAGPLVKALQVAALALRTAFLSNPIGVVIGSVALLAYAIYTHFDKIKHWVGTAWQWCARKAEAALGATRQAMQEVAAAAKTTWASVHSQQEVKIDIHTADPILAGRQAAADINRHHQMALRNTGSAVAF